MPSCRHCQQAFDVPSDDLLFYEKVSPEFAGKKQLIPPPTLCPACRQRSRFAFRNEWSLYHRKCDLTGKQIISVYSPDKPYTVYDQSTWWSDAYDPLAYGKPFDFTRPFFEQFHELNLAAPKIAIQNAKSENCEYTNYSAENKNCYLVVGGLGAEDCLYSYRVFYSSDIVDCFDLFTCRHCYECLECSNLSSSVGCRNCQNGSDLRYCENCTGCNDCFGCINLRNKRFHIYNKPYEEADYRSQIAAMSQALSEETLRTIRTFQAGEPHRAVQVVQCENSTGDQLLECRNCQHCFTLKHSQDCSYCEIGDNNTDCHDANFFDNCQLQYYCSNLEKNYHILFSVLLWYNKECSYCMNCFNSNHLFGCTSMKNNAYCILNWQYTKEEYEELVGNIIDHMKKTGEWGHFFPEHISPFCYNETIAQEHFPLTKKDAEAQGVQWYEENVGKEQYLGPRYDIPPSIADVPDDIVRQILQCEATGKPYKIIPQELAFYREMQIPIPRKCPDQRHKERMALRNPRKLWNRTCAKCEKSIQTTYAPERPAVRGSEEPSGSRREIVYCESCYLETVY